jgi:glycosyltransferase involved in cell wall biosynthesis
MGVEGGPVIDPTRAFGVKLQLPKVAIVGDIPPERTTGGDLLLYRLFADYPSDRLLVVDGPISATNSSCRLEGVSYVRHNYLPAPGRLYSTRFHRALAAVSLYTSDRASRQLRNQLREFGADVVVTVPQGFQWQMAVKSAAASRIPFVLLCHDDWLMTTDCPTLLVKRLLRVFGEAYRAAAARLVVCPSMRDLYREEYDADADVLWPSRGADSPVARLRVRQTGDKFVVAFVGSLFRESYQHLRLVAEALGSRGEAHIYSRQPLRSLANCANVKHCGFASSSEVAERLSATADALFVSMEFGEKSRRGAVTSFPSKIADYTAIGLPMLLLGPNYCSAVEWAKSCPGVAVIAEQATTEAIGAAVRQLQDSIELRKEIAARAMEVGNELFDYKQTRDQFWECLCRVANCNANGN